MRNKDTPGIGPFYSLRKWKRMREAQGKKGDQGLATNLYRLGIFSIKTTLKCIAMYRIKQGTIPIDYHR